MGAFEKISAQEQIYIEDYEDTPFYTLLIKLPPELRLHHLSSIVNSNMTDEDAIQYLDKTLKQRQEATTVSVISDESISEIFKIRGAKIFNDIETSIFNSPDIGTGSTARIKRLELDVDTTIIPMAVKYVVTPNQHTVTATIEHDILKEVERMKTIEEIESSAHLSTIRVPHPFFHHKSPGIQCYAMELIDGFSLKKVLEDDLPEGALTLLKQQFQKFSKEYINEELEKFFTVMHQYCIHNDIKPANMMVSTEGIVYVIDFGQSVLVNDVPEAGRAQLDDLKEDEIRKAKAIILRFFKKLLT